MTQASIHYLSDYRPLPLSVNRIDLHFDIFDEQVIVKSRMVITPQAGLQECVLDGSAALRHIAIDGERLPESAYQHQDEQLRLFNLPQETFVLDITTEVYPHQNKSLMGLYASGSHYFTQCESQGFRKITYFFDRPDVMSKYTVTIVADKARCPVLLSNGNVIDKGELDNARHWVKWQDPYAKPSYLFALVAGSLHLTASSFTTRSGKEVALHFYSEAQDADKIGFAIESLKNAMRWDEERFDLEYDLNIYMVVAVGDFNMGAMENKGLNIFNTKYVLADEKTATDNDFANIESVIGHEYFHNYTGNRVTCRDWFQLSLKEGLTVFRDQEFSADRASRAVRRIQNINVLRSAQFPEDASPNAHPVRPDSYTEINNFYTLTVYEKGAEVVRIYHTLLGEEGFQKGMKLYFQRHDGQAVTCDDFRQAMADANEMDLAQMDLWYSQAGTPKVSITGSLNTQEKTYTLHCTQDIPDTPGQSHKKPMLIPIKMGLLNQHGQAVCFRLPEEEKAQEEATLLLRESQQEFVFYDVDEEKIIPALLRNFSAPVHLNYPYDEQELSVLMKYDSDAFVRWEATQILYKKTIIQNIQSIEKNEEIDNPTSLIANLNHLLNHEKDMALMALMLTIPAQSELFSLGFSANPLHIHQAREALLEHIAQGCLNSLSSIHEGCLKVEQDNYLPQYCPERAGLRSLLNACRSLLFRANPSMIGYFKQQYSNLAKDMTHEMGILNAINHHPDRHTLLAGFAKKYQDNPLVMDKYFALIAASHAPQTMQDIQTALAHPTFSLENPNKVYALLGAFARNPVYFHAKNGSGYRFLSAKIIQIDAFNPQVAARLMSAFNVLPQLDEAWQEQMRFALQHIAAQAHSKDVQEVVNKILLNTSEC